MSPSPNGRKTASSRTPALLAGIVLLAAGLAGVFSSGAFALGTALLAAAGGALIGWSRGGGGHTQKVAAGIPPGSAGSSGNISVTITKTPRPVSKRQVVPAPAGTSGLLHEEDRERLKEWLGEPISVLEEAERKEELTGFNRAHSCSGMGQIAAWRYSVGELYPDADTILRGAQDAIQSALIEAAEHFSPLLESVGEKGGQPIDLGQSRARIIEMRQRTIALLGELRGRLAALPVSTQESFGF